MRSLTLILAALSTLALTGPAMAQPDSFCLPMTDLDEHLARYRETVMVGFIMDAIDGTVIPKLLYGNAQTGDWTQVYVAPDGTACTASHGHGLARSPDAIGLPEFGGDEDPS